VDISHFMGQDVALGPTGDIAMVSGSEQTKQRLLRRLLTNPGDYIWQPQYGAGLPRFIGQPVSVPEIEAVIRAQVALEATVAQIPEPIITVQDNRDGSVFATITYAEAANGSTQTLEVSVP